MKKYGLYVNGRLVGWCHSRGYLISLSKKIGSDLRITHRGAPEVAIKDLSPIWKALGGDLATLCQSIEDIGL